MFYRIIGGTLIQLSDTLLDGYKPVIEEEKPEEQEGYYIAYDYQIIDGEVHKLYRLEEIHEEEMIADDYENGN